MADESIGSAKLDLVVDIKQFDAAISTAKSRLADMSADAQRQYQGLDAREKARVERLMKQADTLNMTKAQQIAYNAALKLEGPILDDLIRKLAQNDAQLKNTGMSAKATAAAMRGVPAQITDIVTSLQGGQKPLTVLFQQGGQLKDMFGGIVPAAKALGTTLVGLINPYTVAAAGTAALVFALKEAQDESYNFQKALIATNNYAAMSVSGFEQMVDQLDAIKGVSRGGAAEALTQVAASGKFAGEQFKEVSRVAAEMEASTGQAVDKTIAKFVDIAKDPVDALLKLNESEHFLTTAQLARVDALIAEGNQQDAANYAIQTYANHLDDVARKSQDAMPAMSKWWQEIKSEASGAVGELETYVNLLAKAVSLNTKGLPGSDTLKAFAVSLLPTTRLRMLNQAGRDYLAKNGYADFSGVTASSGTYVDQNEKARREALKKFNDEESKYYDESTRRAKEKEAVQALLTKGIITQQQATTRLGEIEAYYAAKDAKKSGSSKTNADDNSANSFIASIQRQIEANNQLVATGEKVSTSDRMVIQAKQLLADKTNTMTAATRKLLESMIPQLQQSDAAAEAYQKQAKAADSLARIKEQLALQEQNQQRANEIALMGYGSGSDATEQAKRKLDIERWYADAVADLQKQAAREHREVTAGEEDELKQSLARRLSSEEDYQKQRIALMSDWRNGAKSAWEDYEFGAKDAASQTKSLMTDAFTGAEDAIVKFV